MATPLIAVFGSSHIDRGSADYQEAERLGMMLANRGMAVATGGYAGAMEAVSRGASEAGGEVVGITAPTVFPYRTGGNEYLSEERTATTLSERIHMLVDQTDAAIALGGKLGTLAEVAVAWNAALTTHLARSTPRPVIAVGPLWRSVVDELISQLNVDRTGIELVDTIEEAVKVLAEFFARDPRFARGRSVD